MITFPAHKPGFPTQSQDYFKTMVQKCLIQGRAYAIQERFPPVAGNRTFKNPTRCRAIGARKSGHQEPEPVRAAER